MLNAFIITFTLLFLVFIMFPDQISAAAKYIASMGKRGAKPTEKGGSG